MYGSLVIRASDLPLKVCEFDPWPSHYRSVGTRMGDCLRAGIPPSCVTSHPGQLSPLPSVGREMSTGHSTVMRCGSGVKAGWFIPFVDKREDVGGLGAVPPAESRGRAPGQGVRGEAPKSWKLFAT